MLIVKNLVNQKEFIMSPYALVVDNKFACLFEYPVDGNEIIERNTALLRSNPKIALITEEPQLEKINRYSLSIDNEVVGEFSHIRDEFGSPLSEMINAALQSDPIIVDLTNKDIPEIDSVYDGTNFNI
jgi:hypothetical protein